MLTVLAIQSAKPTGKHYQLSDGNGLSLLVTPQGSKLWRFRYRFGGKEHLLGLGMYPDVSLADARLKRDEERKLLAKGINPSTHRREIKEAQETAGRNTFGVIAEEYIQKLEDEGSAPSTIEKNKWLLLDLAKDLKDRPISQITAAEILVVVRKVEKRGRRDTARRLRGTIGSVFRYAIATLRAENDPTFALRGALAAPVVKHYAAITDERKLGGLMRSIDEYDGAPTLKAALQFLALTMVRPGEVRFMRKSEVVFPRAVWQIPPERMKMRRPFDVPLSTQALAVLRSVWEVSDSSLVFPSVRSSTRPYSDAAFNVALRRMGYGKDEVTAHGFRSSASTILNERGFNPDVIEAALAHQDEDEVRRIYNRAQYFKERQELLQSWADLLDNFRLTPLSLARA